MFSRYDKAWVAALVASLSQVAAPILGIEVSPEFQAAIVTIVTGLAVYLTPNAE